MSRGVFVNPIFLFPDHSAAAGLVGRTVRGRDLARIPRCACFSQTDPSSRLWVIRRLGLSTREHATSFDGDWPRASVSDQTWDCTAGTLLLRPFRQVALLYLARCSFLRVESTSPHLRSEVNAAHICTLPLCSRALRVSATCWRTASGRPLDELEHSVSARSATDQGCQAGSIAA